jgi:hypothetical protein
MDPVTVLGLLLLGGFIGAPVGYIAGAVFTRVKIEDEKENAAWLAERIEQGWSDR